jgi:predicted regulator of Ras-like GTPase activity (Roadblock/LC7/MglB family)
MMGLMELSRLQLTEERSRSMRHHLRDLVNNAGLSGAAILMDSGAVIAHASQREWNHLDELGALAVGTFYSAREISKRLGENHFSGLHYEGAHSHFFLWPLRGDFILLCTFGQETKLASVRSCCQRHSQVLNTELRTASHESQETAALPADGMGLSAAARW